MRRVPMAAALVACLWTVRAAGHEILHETIRDRAVAVKVYYPDGEPLAYTEYQVYSPADPAIPYQKGRTDRDGYVAFVPNTPGAWRVVIADATGHGLDLRVDTTAPATQPSPPSLLPAWSFVLRPVLGMLAVVGVFMALFFVQRRRIKGSRQK